MKHKLSRLALSMIIPLSVILMAWQDQWKNIYTESAWVERDAWQKAPELIRFLNLKPGSSVADIGCHEGYMSVKLAWTVGSNGRVFAIDLDAPKLEKLKANLEKRGISNVTAIQSEVDNPKLPNQLLDAVIILDTYHEIRAHQKMLEHISTALKPSGRLLICEPIADERKSLSREE